MLWHDKWILARFGVVGQVGRVGRLEGGRGGSMTRPHTEVGHTRTPPCAQRADKQSHLAYAVPPFLCVRQGGILV